MIKGQTPPKSIHFYAYHYTIFKAGYINFWSVVFQILHKHAHAQTDATKDNASFTSMASVTVMNQTARLTDRKRFVSAVVATSSADIHSEHRETQ